MSSTTSIHMDVTGALHAVLTTELHQDKCGYDGY